MPRFDSLKPCPFCGSDAVHYLKTYDTVNSEPHCYMQVGCRKCGVFFTTSHFKIVDIPRIPDEDVSEVIAAWNRRVCR